MPAPLSASTDQAHDTTLTPSALDTHHDRSELAVCDVLQPATFNFFPDRGDVRLASFSVQQVILTTREYPSLQISLRNRTLQVPRDRNGDDKNDGHDELAG